MANSESSPLLSPNETTNPTGDVSPPENTKKQSPPATALIDLATVVGGVCRLVSFRGEVESNSYDFNNQMKVWLSKEVGTGDEFGQEMGHHCYLLRKEMEERDRLIAELEKLVVGTGATRYVQILRRRQDRDGVKLGLLKDLLRLAREETHERQLELDGVDYN
ncbi:hypothetical protein Tco_1181701 [Tanacetum coccineum]